VQHVEILKITLFIILCGLENEEEDIGIVKLAHYRMIIFA